MSLPFHMENEAWSVEGLSMSVWSQKQLSSTGAEVIAHRVGVCLALCQLEFDPQHLRRFPKSTSK